MKHELYDLVKVIGTDPKDVSRFFYGSIGIIDQVDKDIEDKPLYHLLFVGKATNASAKKVGGVWFYDEELEGI